MKILTSYFYQIRNFKPTMVPLSTALFDPRYYHKGFGMDYQFYDKNGVLNGMRAEPFVPGEACEGLCQGPDHCPTRAPAQCKFLNTYLEQLRKLDFEEIIERFEKLEKKIQETKNLEDELTFVLIVYETPRNPCSERWAIHKWFKENGYEIKELDFS